MTKAAAEAARADGVFSGDGPTLGSYGEQDTSFIPARRGKWTTEEGDYAERLIHEFKEGRLPLSEGTTLRTFLSKVLNCDPMRISKKFVGANSIGKQIFRRKRLPNGGTLSEAQLAPMHDELGVLEKRFLDRVTTHKGRGRGRQSTAANGETSRGGRQASSRKYAEYEYGEQDEGDYETTGYTANSRAVSAAAAAAAAAAGSTASGATGGGRNVKRKTEGTGRGRGRPPGSGKSNAAAAAVAAAQRYQLQQTHPNAMQSTLQHVTSLELLAMDGHQVNAYQAQMQMRYGGAGDSMDGSSPSRHSVVGDYEWQPGGSSVSGGRGMSVSPVHPPGLPLEHMKSPLGGSGGGGGGGGGGSGSRGGHLSRMGSWSSVQNLLEAATAVYAQQPGGSIMSEKPPASQQQQRSSSSSSSSSGSSSSGSSNNLHAMGGGPEPPSFRDLSGMGCMKRSAAHAQLEASTSHNNLNALATASARASSENLAAQAGGATPSSKAVAKGAAASAARKQKQQQEEEEEEDNDRDYSVNHVKDEKDESPPQQQHQHQYQVGAEEEEQEQQHQQHAFGGNHNPQYPHPGGNNNPQQEQQSRVQWQQQTGGPHTDSVIEFQNRLGGPPKGHLASKSSSIQNFWLLVENGDIPKPEENVLVEPIMKLKRQGSGAAKKTD
jgi:hypothetical protein